MVGDYKQQSNNVLHVKGVTDGSVLNNVYYLGNINPIYSLVIISMMSSCRTSKLLESALSSSSMASMFSKTSCPSLSVISGGESLPCELDHRIAPLQEGNSLDENWNAGGNRNVFLTSPP